MAGSSNLVEIIVTAEDKASSVLRGLTGMLETVGSVAIAGGGLAVGALRDIGAGALSLAAAAAPIAGVGSAFEALTQGMQGGAAQMLSALQDSSGGLITNTDLMKSFNTAAALVSTDFATRLPDAMTYLSRVSAATGEDMNFLLDSLVKGVGRLSTPILDNLGIQLNLTEAYQAYAESVGKSTDELTKSEQQTALMNTVMEKLASNTEGMTAMANPFSALKVMISNLKDEVGLKLLPVITPLVSRFQELAETAISRLTPALDSILSAVSLVGEAFLSFIDHLLNGTPLCESLATALSKLLPPEVTGVILDFGETILPAIIEGLRGLWDIVLSVLGPIIEAVGQFVSWKDVMAGIAVSIASVLIPAIIGFVSTFASAIAGVVAAFAVVTALVVLLRTAWENNWLGIRDITAAVWSVLQTAFSELQTFILGTVIPAAQALYDKWVTEIWPTIQTVTTNVWAVIRAIFTELGRWINDNLVPWLKFLHAVWVEQVWPAIQNAIRNAWNIIRPIWETLKEWLEATIPNALRPLSGIFAGVMGSITAAIVPVRDAWSSFVSAVQGFWNWLTGKVFTFEISLPDLPTWAAPPSTSPTRAAGKAFTDDLDKGGSQLTSGLEKNLGSRTRAASPLTAARSASLTVNIDARGAAAGVEREIRRVVELVLQDYGWQTDSRMRLS